MSKNKTSKGIEVYLRVRPSKKSYNGLGKILNTNRFIILLP